MMTSQFPPKVSAILARMNITPSNAAHWGAARLFAQIKAEKCTVTRALLWQLDAFCRGVDRAHIDRARQAQLLDDVKNLPPVAPLLDSAVMHNFMREALIEAQIALANHEVPVGAVLIRDGQIIARNHNRCKQLQSSCAHAELALIQSMEQERLSDCDLYVSLEPCAMCAGAIINARIRRLIFAASEPKTGAAGSVLNLFDYKSINHHTAVIGGICRQQSVDLLQQFFAQKRSQ